MEFFNSTRGMSPDAIAKAVEREFADLHYISDTRLARLCHTDVDGLEHVQKLEITLDAAKHSVSRIGKFLPRLQSLRFGNNSFLSGFRDLGTSLRCLRILWAPRAGIADVDGISALPELRELYIPFNNVSDLTPLSMHENIQVLDLEGNALDEVEQLVQLGTCTALATLSLADNPVAQIDSYRRVVLKNVPQLEQLDDEPFNNNERQEVLDEDAYEELVETYTNNRVGKGGVKGGDDRRRGGSASAGNEESLVTETLRRKGAREGGSDLYRLGDRQRSGAGGRRSASSSIASDDGGAGKAGANGGGGRPTGRPARRPSISKFVATNAESALTAAPPSPKGVDHGRDHISSSSSDLTHGAEVVFAGSAVHALRRRKSEHENAVYRGANAKAVKARHFRGKRSAADEKKDAAADKARDKRLSIMATLDRVMEMEQRMNDASISSETKEDVLSELAKWKMDAQLIEKRKVVLNTKASRIRPSSASVGDRGKRLARPQTARGNEHMTDRPRSSPLQKRGGRAEPRGEHYERLAREYKKALVPGSPEWRRSREREKRHLKDQQFLKTPEKKFKSHTLESPGSSGRKSRQPGEMMDILVDWGVRNEKEKKKSKRAKGRKSKAHPAAVADDDSDDAPNTREEEEEEVGPSPDTLWRAERAKRRQEHADSMVMLKSASDDNSSETNSEADIDAQIEEMNSRIQRCEAWGNSVGYKSPASPTTSPGVKAAFKRTPSPKAVSPAISDHGLPSSTDEGGRKPGTAKAAGQDGDAGRKKLELGNAVYREDEDLIELLRVKPKRVPELRTHDGFQQFFSGIQEKRMRRLLSKAFDGMESKDKRKKIKRRMALLDGFMRK
jgi:hypothetical protein